MYMGVLYSTLEEHPISEDGNVSFNRHVFIFPYGCIVFWGCTKQEEETFIEQVMRSWSLVMHGLGGGAEVVDRGTRGRGEGGSGVWGGGLVRAAWVARGGARGFRRLNRSVACVQVQEWCVEPVTKAEVEESYDDLTYLYTEHSSRIFNYEIWLTTSDPEEVRSSA
jgi:hypothetical protein